MSRQAPLPPRCPSQKKPLSHPEYGSMGDNSYRRHQRSSSQSFIPEEQPAWLNDLLSEPDSNSERIPLRRSSSDSATFLDNFMKSSMSMTSNDDEDNAVSNYETYSGLESACVYGPNSPRQRENSHFLENAIASVFSEYATQDPLSYGEGGSCSSTVTNSSLKEDACTSAGGLNPETKPLKRHSGQRSRVRKLQYIAELEQTVNALQNLESDLAARVTAVLHRRTALSIENSKLKQQVIRLQQDKLIMEGEYRSLKNEAEKLRMRLGNSPKGTAKPYFALNSATTAAGSNASWQVPDIGKLSLN